MNTNLENEHARHRRGTARTGVNPKQTGHEGSVYDEGSIVDKELVAGANERIIFKHVDFEIMSERGSQMVRPTKLRSESWEDVDSKYARI
jgi:hypothetical protein